MRSSFIWLLQLISLFAAATPLVLAWNGFAFCSEINDAAVNGEAAKVTALLKADPSLVSSRDGSGATPLHLAAANGHKDVAEILIANHADVNAQTMSQRPSHETAGSGYSDVMQLLMGNKPEVITNNSDAATPLHYAAGNGHKDVAEVLVANKAEVDARDKYGKTPLHYAAASGAKDVAEFLLANKAQVDAKSHEGATPLHWAAGDGHKNVAEVLLANKANVDAKANHGETPLYLAAQKGYKDVAELLLTNHADINAGDNSGKTPLLVAVAQDQKGMVEFLVANKANVNARTIDGMGPLRMATDRDDQDLAQLLLANQADVNARDNNGSTPLTSALALRHRDMAEFLRQHGAISKPIDAPLQVLSNFLRTAYFLPTEPRTPPFDLSSAASYRKGKVTYYKSFVSIDEDGYTFALSDVLQSHILVGHSGSRAGVLVSVIPVESVHVKFADIVRIKADQDGSYLRLLSSSGQLDTFSISAQSRRDVQDALRTLCPNAQWK